MTTIRVAALLVLLTSGGLTTSARAQCGSGSLILLNTNSFAYETPNAVGAPYVSPPGNQLTIVGLVQQFCVPLDGLNAADPDTDYTVVFSGLTSLGTTSILVGPTTFYVTSYAGGSFSIYQNSPRSAFTSAADLPGYPPNPAIPSRYQMGTAILSGTLSNFGLTVTQTAGHPALGTYSSNFTFTGGTLYPSVAGAGSSTMFGLWCVSGCLPSAGGYSAQLGGSLNLDLSADQDGDGVPDVADACPAASAAGQDSDANGCVDPTSTMLHVESWANSWLPLHFRISDVGIPGIVDGSDRAAIRAAFQTWQNVPGALLQVTEQLPTDQVIHSGLDEINLITFQDSSYPFSPSVLAVTPTLSFTRRQAYGGRIVLPGQIVDADVLFNPTASFSTPTHPGSWDLQSVATHEIGHFLGLSHSGARNATMFYVQQPGMVAATLKDDDRAAIAAAYPAATLLTDYATIRGKVTRGDSGQPLPGALVTVMKLDALGAPLGDVVASDYTREDGSYALFRLSPGTYGVHIQALDGTMDGLTPAFISLRIEAIAQTNFQPEWYSAPENSSDDPDSKQPLALSVGQEMDGVDIVTNIDTTPPAIVNASPSDGNANVRIDAAVAIAFSEAVDASTISTALRVHKLGQTTRLVGSGLLANFGRTLIFTPDVPLEYGTPYVLEVTTALTDLEGLHLASPFSNGFTTQSIPPLAINLVQPQTVPQGGVISVTGQGFTSGDVITVHFASAGVGGMSAPTSVVNGVLVASVPAGVTPGMDGVSLEVVNVSGTFMSNQLPLQIVSPPPQTVPTAAGAPIALAFSPTGVALSSDGGMAYVVGGGGLVTINLDASRANFRVPISHLAQAAQSARLTPDGTRLVISQPAGNDLLLIDASPTSGTLGAVLDTIPLPASPAGVAIDPTGQRAYVTDPSHGMVYAADIRIGFASTGQVVKTYSSSIPLGGGIVVQPDGARLILGGIGGSTTIGVADNLQTLLVPYDAAGPVAVDPSGVQVFVPASGGQLATGTTNGSLAPSLVSTGGQPRDVAVSPFGQSAFVVNGPLNQLQVVNADPSSPSFRTAVGEVGTGSGPVALAISGNGNLIAVANGAAHSLSLFSTGIGGPALAAVTPNVAMPGDQVVAVNGGAAGSTFAGASFDLGSGPTPAVRGLAAGASFFVPSSFQRDASVTVELPSSARSLSLPFRIVGPIATLAPKTTGRFFTLPPGPCAPAPETGPVDLMRISPDGRFLAVHRAPSACPDDIALIEITDDGPHGFGAAEPLVSLTPGSSLSDFAFSADGRQLWAALRTNEIHILDADPMSPTFGQTTILSAPATVGAPRGIVADPLGRRIIVSGTGVRFFMRDQTLEKSVPGFITPASGIALTPDGHRAVIGGADQAFFVDVDLETFVATSPAHAGAGNVDRIAVTTDGKRALGVFADGSVSVWVMDPAVGPFGTESYHGMPVAAAIKLQSPVPGVDGHSVLLADGNGGNLVKLDLAMTPPAATVVPMPQPALTIQRSLDGRRLFSAKWSGSPVVADLQLFDLSRATQFALVSGDLQTAMAGNTLPAPIEVRVTDPMGGPQEGVVVRFDLGSAANGSFPGTAALQLEKITDTNGQARTMWQLPASGAAATLMIGALGVAAPPIQVGATIAADDNLISPVILEFGPPEGSTGTNAGSPMLVRFNQKMSQTSLESHLGLFSNGAPVAGSLHLEDLGHTAIFQPNAPLAFSARCSLAVRMGATDLEGQTLAADAHSVFSIQGPPTVLLNSISPPAGPAGAPVVLDGSGFSATLSSNTVTFNGAIGLVTSGDLVSLVATAPPAAMSGPVMVRVGASTSNTLDYTVLAPNPNPGGAIGSVSGTPGLRDIALTPDGTRIYVTNPATNAVSAFDAVSAASITDITVGSRPQGIAIVPDGSRAYVANAGSNSVSVLDVNPASPNYNQVIQTIAVGQSPGDVEVSPVGPTIYVLNQGAGTVSIIDGQPGDATFNRVTTTVNVGSSATTIRVLTDGSRMYVTNNAGFEVVDLHTNQVTATVNLGSAATAIHVLTDGTLAFVLTAGGQLVIVSLNPGPQQYQVTTTVNVGSAATSVHVSTDGTLAYVTNGDNNTVQVYQISISTTGSVTVLPTPIVSLTLVATIPVGAGPATLAFDPTGKSLGYVVNAGAGSLTIIGSPTFLPRVTIDFDIDPGTLNLKSMGKWVKGTLRPPAPHTPDQIVISSILLNGVVAVDPAAPHSISGGDDDGDDDDAPALTVRFLRHDLELILPLGDHVAVTATGSFQDSRTFTGTDFIKVKRGRVVAPVAGVVIPPGSPFEVRWETPDSSSVAWVAMLYSVDHGNTWLLDADHLPNTGSYLWQVPNEIADSVRVAIVWVETVLPFAAQNPDSAQDLMVSGTLAVSDYASIQGATDVRSIPTALAFGRIQPNPASQEARMRYALPRPASVKLEIFDLQGRRVRTLARGVRNAGWYDVRWNGRTDAGERAGAGLYFVRFEALGREFRQRVVWLH